MGSRQNVVPLIIALILAVLAGVASWYYLSNTTNQAQLDAQDKLNKLGSQVPVVVPLTDISPGSAITLDNVKMSTRYQADIQGLKVVTGTEPLKGMYASTWLYNGEPIIANRITSHAGETQVAELPSKQIPPTKKAFALSISPEQAVGGLMGTGDYIDVYSSTAGVSTLIYSDVHVLCISGQFPCGGSISTDTTNPNSGFNSTSNGNTIRGGVQSGSKILILDLDDNQITTLTGLLTSNGKVYVALHSSKKLSRSD